MKKNLWIRHLLSGLTVLFACSLGLLNAQTLSLKQVELPDSGIFTFRVPAKFTIQNTSEVNQIGNLKLWFLNPGKDSVMMPLGGFDALQLFAPGQQREIEVEIELSPGLFIEGGNTVVIWPSFIGKPEISSDSVSVNIFVTSAANSPTVNEFDEILLIQNPVEEVLNIQITGKHPHFVEFSLLDLSGRVVAESAVPEIPVSTLMNGIYILQMRTDSGKIASRRIIKHSR